jgi:transcriptional regulator GlxA family with amidase domain
LAVAQRHARLAKTGLLSGKAATTHHSSYADLASAFPDIRVKRGTRFVEEGNLASAGGLSSGIDLSLRVVERCLNVSRLAIRRSRPTIRRSHRMNHSSFSTMAK